MEYLKKEIRTFQNGKTVNDQFYIDDDYNVPDAKKDVRDITGGRDETGRKLSESDRQTGIQSFVYCR